MIEKSFFLIIRGIYIFLIIIFLFFSHISYSEELPSPAQKTHAVYERSLQSCRGEGTFDCSHRIVSFQGETDAQGNIRTTISNTIGSSIGSHVANREDAFLFAANDLSPDRPPTDITIDSWDIIGEKGKYFHPSLTFSGVYTDNAFHSSENEESDFSTYLSPEIWITVPRNEQRPSGIQYTSSRNPGGLALSRYQPEIKRRYQSYLMYRADIPITSDNSPSGKTVTHKAGGGFAYKGNRVSLDAADYFYKGYEERGTGIDTGTSDVDRYYSNLFSAIVRYDTRNRFRLEFDYSNYYLDYNSSRNAFRDRMDNALSGYIFYKLRPKTAAFFEYTFITVDYDDNSTLDSKEHNFYGGLLWDMTAKTRGLVKAGYGIKDFDNTGEDTSNFILETQINYRFTPKTSLRISAYRKTNETDISQTNYILTNGIEAEYQQMLTAKITALANLAYINDNYDGDFAFGGKTDEREDDTYQVGVGLQYKFKRWLTGGIGYVYTDRDSNFPDFDYTSNTVFFRVTGSL